MMKISSFSTIFLLLFSFQMSAQETSLRINTGGSEVDYNSETYIADAYFDTGSTLVRPQTGLPEPYQSFRYSSSQEMSYAVPVADGEYTVNLHFAELWFGATGGGAGGVGSRVFDINIEGALAEDNLDVFAEVGAETMLVKSHTVSVTDGVLDIDFSSLAADGGVRHPIINAIEILERVTEPVGRPFIFSFSTILYSGVDGLTFTIPIDSQYQYNYSIDWGDGSSDENLTGEISHIYASHDSYMVKISGDYPRPMLSGENSCAGSDFKILQWGDQKWQNLERAFYGTNLNLEATDIPDLSECSSIRSMFENSRMTGSGMALIPQWDISGFTDFSGLFKGTGFNEDISDWDVSHVTDMSFMFSIGTVGCGDSPASAGSAFNQDLSSWNVSNVENMTAMFNGANFNHDLSSWNVSKVTDMKGMFAASKFDQDISNWDVSQVTNMSYMFSGEAYIEASGRSSDFFTHPINNWDVSNVIDMSNMFSYNKAFDQPLNNWDVSNVTNMGRMFFGAEAFNQNIGAWDVSNLTSMSSMFRDADAFNQDIRSWDVSNITNMSEIFRDAIAFNQDIDEWNVSNVTNMSGMFRGAKTFNQDIGGWDVSKVTNMNFMFMEAEMFNQDISGWNVSNVLGMSYLFNNAKAFDQNLGDWNVSNVVSGASYTGVGMWFMFTNSGLSNANYDKTLIGWNQLPSLQNGVQLDAPQNLYCDSKEARQNIIDTYNWTINDNGRPADCGDTTTDFALRINAGGTEIDYNGETFGEDAYSNTGSVLDRPQTGLPEPYQSFRYSRSQQMSYNIPLADGEYTVSLYFAELWFGATGGGSGGVGSRVFDVNIEGALAEDNLDVFAEVGADAMLMKTHTVIVTGGVLNIDFDSRDEVGGERHPIINAIEILGEVTNPETRPFVTTWKTDNPGKSSDNQITIPTDDDETYNYTVNWGDGSITDNITGDITHNYESPGTYTISISGNFPLMGFQSYDPYADQSDRLKLLSIDQWGDIEWASMKSAFYGCENMDVVALDTPDLTMVGSTAGMFFDCNSLLGNETFKEWDVSNITNMGGMFLVAENFNQDIGDWDVSNVTNMANMFSNSTYGMGSKFNQNISSWDVSNVTNMAGMFQGTRFFDQDISGWDVSNVTNMSGMFRDSEVFNQEIRYWDVSNVTDMSAMFGGALKFNQPVVEWDVSHVTRMGWMFRGAINFNQDLGNWDVSGVESTYGWSSGMKEMFTDSGLSNENYDKTIIGWSQLPSLQNGVQLDAPQSRYCDAEQSRQLLIDTYGWTINDGGKDEDCAIEPDRPFIFSHATYYSNGSELLTFTIPIDSQYDYNYSVDWGDGSIDENQTGEASHTYEAPYDRYVVKISGEFPRPLLNFKLGFCENKDLVILQWGDQKWQNLEAAFANTRVRLEAIDIPDVSECSSIKNMFNDSGMTGTGMALIPQWDISGFTDLSGLFRGTYFNEDISDWDVSHVTDLSYMFSTGNWGCGDSSIYQGGSFNQDISSWNVSNVENMTVMFNGSEFNQDISSWDVSQVTNMRAMFSDSKFNQNISNWNVSQVANISFMFSSTNVNYNDRLPAEESNFNQTLNDWDVSNVTDMTNVFSGSGLSNENYDKTLIGWSQLPSLQNGVTLDAPQNQYCDAEQARQQIIDTYGWTINDAGLAEDCSPVQGRPFIIDVIAYNFNNNSVTIPVHPDYAYNYTVDWGDGTISSEVTGNITHIYSTNRRVEISISGNFPGIYYNNGEHTYQLLEIVQWGDIEWQTFEGAFHGCDDLSDTPTDIPNLSNVSSMSNMFDDCHSLRTNNSFGDWDVSSVTDMKEMFKLTSQFNSDVGDWDVGNVKTLRGTFAGAGAFNQDLSRWDVSNVENMFATFNLASSFNQDLGSWDIQNVSNLGYFLNNTATSITNYDSTLEAWANLNDLNLNLNLGAHEITYCNSVDARQKLIDDYGWTVEDAGKAADCEEPNDFSLLINTGGTETDYNGETFIADSYFNTGSTLDRPQTGLPEPYQTFRYSRSQQMSYDIPLEDGEYTVNLYFAELWFGATGGGAGGVGSRVFDVNIEGQLAEDNLDIFAEVGADAMLMKSHTVMVTGGVLDIDFSSLATVGGVRHPVINAIEIIGNVASVPTLALRGTSANSNKSVLSPNPVISTTSLSFEQPVQLSDIQVFDVSGRLVRTFKAAEVSADGAYNLKVHGLESGNYFINALDKQGVKHQKQMVIKK